MNRCHQVDKAQGETNQGVASSFFVEGTVNFGTRNSVTGQVLIIVGLFISAVFDIFFALMFFRYYRHLRQTQNHRATPVFSTVCRQQSAEPMCQPGLQEVTASPMDYSFPPSYPHIGRAKNDA
uniref:Uncharacterized protein n=1 Tax=Steinernema glaseri TaxID=37863 RepID=A0A1I7Z2V9_9BILA